MSNCDGDCPKCLADIADSDGEFLTPDGVFIKKMYLPKVGDRVAQHSHTYAHTSLLVTGGVRVWAAGKFAGDFTGTMPINIPALVMHTFMATEPDTLVLCIHNLNGAKQPSIAEFAEGTV